MKISFSTLGCPRWSWREILATACDLGYGGVEVRGVGNDISVPSIPAFSDENIDRTKAELRRLNLMIPCLDSDCCIHLRETEQTTDEEIRAYIGADSLALAQQLKDMRNEEREFSFRFLCRQGNNTLGQFMQKMLRPTLTDEQKKQLDESLK